MAFLGWFKNKKEKEVLVSKRNQDILEDTAVATTFAEAGEHETARSIMSNENKKGHNTILVIGREDSFSETLASYALGMAKRLDFTIMAVNITEKPLALAEDAREEAVAEFEKKCFINSAFFNQKAASADIPLHHLMLVGTQDEMIEKIHNLYPGMRYVLTEPDPEVANKGKEKVSIPVFDLGSFQGATA